MASSKFELKEGLSIRCHNKGVHVSNENLTDELAEALLKEKPHHARNFIKLPDEYKKKAEANAQAGSASPAPAPAAADKKEKPAKS